MADACLWCVGQSDVVESQNFLRAVAGVYGAEADGGDCLAVALEVVAYLLPGLLVLGGGELGGGAAAYLDKYDAVAAESRFPYVGRQVVVAFGKAYLLGEGDGRCSPVLAHPVGVAAAARGLGARREEVGEVEVAALQGGEVVVVGIGVVYRPPFGDVYGAVAAHA